MVGQQYLWSVSFSYKEIIAKQDFEELPLHKLRPDIIIDCQTPLKLINQGLKITFKT